VDKILIDIPAVLSLTYPGRIGTGYVFVGDIARWHGHYLAVRHLHRILVLCNTPRRFGLI
jgi:hypothetical protein